MKNTARKLLAFVLAAVLVLALNTVAFAAEQPVDATKDSYTIKIKTTVENPGSFSAYQIFKGDLAKDEEGNLILSNIEWGNGIADTVGALAAIQAIEGFKDATDAAAVAEALGKFGADSDEAKAFAAAIAPFLTQNAHTSAQATGKDQEVTITVDDAGYYMVKSNEPTGEGVNTENYAETRYMLEVVGDVDVTEKASVPSVDKEVLDVNDSNAAPAEPEWGETADHDIGDHVSFRLTGTLPKTLEEYETYAYTFKDQLSDGLDFDGVDTVKVTVNGTEIDKSLYTVTADGHDITISFTDIKSVPGVNKDAKIVVEYTAILNESAVIGPGGNSNTVYLEFSNNPNGEGTGKTPQDKVVVFTFEYDVNKVDKDNNPLQGAAFAMYKKYADANAETEGAVQIGKDGKIYDAENPAPEGTALFDGYYKLVKEFEAGDQTKFEYKGIDDGTYVVVETATPAGYNSIDPFQFEITSTTDATNETLTNVTFTPKDTDVKITSEDGLTGSATSGVGASNIVNQSGAQLPSTGGIGTTIFYVVGAILAVGAGILLIAKKRMQNHE